MAMLYKILLITQFLVAPIVFFSLFKVVALYGRYVNTPQKQKHHYVSYRLGWLIMELPAAITIFVLYCIALFQGYEIPIFAIIALIFWELHYVYRACIFPFLSANKPKEFSLYVVVGGLIFNIINGFINGWALFFTPLLKETTFLDIHVYIGMTIFLIGFLTHIISDKMLRNIKRINNGKYGIPTRFLYTYVTSPNYFGEIIQWFGFFIITLSPAALAFVIFTFSNLMPRAYTHRIWYREKFQNFPAKRKIIIPFLL